VRLPKVSGPTLQANREGVIIGAHPIEGRENYWDLFDDELPQIGIAALWVRIENSRSEPVDLSDLSWTLEARGESFSNLSTDQVLDRYYDRRGIRFYSVNSDRKAREDLEKVMLKTGRLLPAAISQGFVFLDIDPAAGNEWSHGAKLFVRGIRLENRQKLEFELSPVDAHP
jgi:hypothetical protein